MRTPATTEYVTAGRFYVSISIFVLSGSSHPTKKKPVGVRACVRACVPHSPLLDSSFLSSSSGTIASGRLSRLPTITRGYISHRKSRTKDRPAGVLTPRSSVSSIVPPTRRPLPCLLRARSRPRCRTCCPPPPSPPPLSFLSIDRSLFDCPLAGFVGILMIKLLWIFFSFLF